MRMYSCYSRSHKVLVDNFFLPSIPDDVQLILKEHPQICETACFYQKNWMEAVRGKIPFLVYAIQENLGNVFVFSDCDVQFFGPILNEISKEMEGFDLAFQNENGSCCTGFFACRGSQEVHDFFRKVYEEIPLYGGDQKTVNELLPQYPHLKIKKLSSRFWTHAGKDYEAPKDILVHHANCTTGIENKIRLLDKIKNQVRDAKRQTNIQSPLACCSSKGEVNGSRKTLFDVEYVFNELDTDVDWMIDIGQKSQLSENFPPEQRIWVHVEPCPYTPYFDEFQEYYQGGIFSWHPKIEHLPQFKKVILGIRGVATNFSTNKIFGVSGLIGPKCFEWAYNLEKAGHKMEGYRLRRTIIEKQNEIKIPSMVWNCRALWKGQLHHYPLETKSPSLEHMFHFAVENCAEKNYFTEKITDCFLTCCVPLYFGDPKAVAEHFNMDGVIVITEENWIDKVNSLTEKDYYDRIPDMEENLSKALMFLHETEDVYKNISRVLLRR